MTLKTACPKPAKPREALRAQARVEKARARQDRWRQQAIARAKEKPRTKVKERNEVRIARRAKAYAAVIRSAFHKLLRYLAFQRSGGLCECEECAEIRTAIEPENRFTLSWGFADQPFADTRWTRGEVARAFMPIPCWFVKGGGVPHLRFRSTEGELHHDSYKYFGEENLAELEVVRFTWTSCHQRIEAEHSTRRNFLRGKHHG